LHKKFWNKIEVGCRIDVIFTMGQSAGKIFDLTFSLVSLIFFTVVNLFFHEV